MRSLSSVTTQALIAEYFETESEVGIQCNTSSNQGHVNLGLTRIMAR